MALLLMLGALMLVFFLTAIRSTSAHDRVRDHVKNMHGELVSISRKPFALGDLFERDTHTLVVRYRNRQGKLVEVECKAGLFSGPYCSTELVVEDCQPAAASPSPEGMFAAFPADATDNAPVFQACRDTNHEKLFAENKNLREENSRLREEIRLLRERGGD